MVVHAVSANIVFKLCALYACQHGLGTQNPPSEKNNPGPRFLPVHVQRDTSRTRVVSTVSNKCNLGTHFQSIASETRYAGMTPAWAVS